MNDTPLAPTLHQSIQLKSYYKKLDRLKEWLEDYVNNKLPPSLQDSPPLISTSCSSPLDDNNLSSRHSICHHDNNLSSRHSICHHDNNVSLDDDSSVSLEDDRNVSLEELEEEKTEGIRGVRIVPNSWTKKLIKASLLSKCGLLEGEQKEMLEEYLQGVDLNKGIEPPEEKRIRTLLRDIESVFYLNHPELKDFKNKAQSNKKEKMNVSSSRIRNV